MKEKENLKLVKKKKGRISSLGYPYIFFFTFMFFCFFFFMSPNLYIANEKGMGYSSGLFSKSFSSHASEILMFAFLV